jgi:hypothetical protein
LQAPDARPLPASLEPLPAVSLPPRVSQFSEESQDSPLQKVEKAWWEWFSFPIEPIRRV